MPAYFKSQMKPSPMMRVPALPKFQPSSPSLLASAPALSTLKLTTANAIRARFAELVQQELGTPKLYDSLIGFGWDSAWPPNQSFQKNITETAAYLLRLATVEVAGVAGKFTEEGVAWPIDSFGWYEQGVQPYNRIVPSSASGCDFRQPTVVAFTSKLYWSPDGLGGDMPSMTFAMFADRSADGSKQKYLACARVISDQEHRGLAMLASKSSG